MHTFHEGAQAGLLLFKQPCKHLNRSQLNGLHQFRKPIVSKIQGPNIFLQQFSNIKLIVFPSKIICNIYFLLICVNHVQLANILLVCVHHMLDGNHQSVFTRLSMYQLVILVTHASQLYLTRLHHFTASHLTAFVIFILSEEGEHMHVSVCFDPEHSVF